MALTRYYVKEFPRRNSVKFEDVVPKTQKPCVLPFTETRLLLAILGGLPCQLRSPYWPSLDLFKSTFLYSVLIYAVASYNVAWSIGLKLKQIEDEVSEDNRIIQLEQIVGFLPHSIVLALWKDTHAISEFMKNFLEMQSKFFDATGEELVNRRVSLERALNAFLIFAPVSYLIFTQIFIPVMFVDRTTGITITYSNVVMFLGVVYWIGISVRLTDAFDDAKNALQRQIITKKITPQSLYKFRLLWLCMRSEMDSLGQLVTPGAFHSITLFLAVVVVYVGAKFVLIHDFLAGAGHLLTATAYFGLFGLACVASHRVQEKMKAYVGEVLPKIMLSSYDIGSQREIVMLFLTENTRPAVITLHGFQVVNKNLMLSFISNVATYIIVFLQFQDKK